MVLNDEQVNRFFDTMDSLLYYVNERFHVVKDLSLESGTMMDDVKTAMVARELWNNVEIIDEFVSSNPYGLPQKCLDVAAGWKYALPDFYTLVRYQSGRGLLMSEAGVFSVCGVTYELEDEIGPAPAGVELVLLPFDDVIVYDGFLQAYDLGGNQPDRESRRIQDEFERRCSDGIATTSREFIERAQAFLEAQREREFESLLAGAVESASSEEGEELPKGFHRGVLAGLSGLERDLAIGEYRVKHPEAFVRPGQANADRLTFEDELPNELASYADEMPQGLPPEYRTALTCVDAATMQYGIASVADVFAQYRALCAESLSYEAFQTLVASETWRTGAGLFDVWTYSGVDYITHYSLSPDYVAQEFMQTKAGSSGLFVNRETGEIGGSPLGGLSGSGGGDLVIELGRLEQYKRDLVEMRKRELPMKPLSRRVLEQDIVSGLLSDPSALALRDFLDERVPDGEDDYTFADHVVEDVIRSSLELGSLEEVFMFAVDLGLEHCCADEKRLAQLLTNVYNAVPSWENNGWSPQELYEQMTGRKMFYNADGTIMRIGADEPCPCGSGKKYRDCCGQS